MQITLEFKVHGQGKTLFGDGFAVWFTKEPSQEGPVFGSKDFFRGIGIFFDTYSNVRQVCYDDLDHDPTKHRVYIDGHA